jgi:hypothetical protein
MTQKSTDILLIFGKMRIIQGLDSDIDIYQIDIFGKIWNQRATLSKDHNSNNLFKCKFLFFLYKNSRLLSVSLEPCRTQVFFDADPDPRWGSLDRALYTPGRVNIIGAIRGGAYLKLPREGNW